MKRRVVAAALISLTLVVLPYVIDAIAPRAPAILAAPYVPGIYALWVLQEIGLDLSDNTGDITDAEAAVFISLSAFFWFGCGLAATTLAASVKRNIASSQTRTLGP